MIKLTQWEINEAKHKNEKYYFANGTVSGHTDLFDGTYIHTSKIISIIFNEDNNKLIMKTHSNNEYELRMTDILLGKYATTVEYLKKFNVKIPSYDECKRMADSVEEAFLANLDKLLKDSELYLKMNGVFVQKAYWKKNEIRTIEVRAHIGMNQDSYLVTDWEKHEVDFRYFDGLFGIRPYHFSDGLNAILIDNIGSSDIGFTSGEYYISCKAGEITTIGSEHFNEEGLVSPDVVNGKSVFLNDFKLMDCDETQTTETE